MLADELSKLVGKAPADTKIGFIPTAALAEPGNKDWFFGQVDNLQKYGWQWIDVANIVDPVIDWRRRLSEVDVVSAGGGNTFYLLDAMRRAKFGEWFEGGAADKVYVGVSAGMIVMTPSIDVATIPPADDNFLHVRDPSGLRCVEVEIEPHCAGDRYETMGLWAQKNQRNVFTIDDSSGLVFVGNGAPKSAGTGRIEEFNHIL